jgi:hypothetical protein
MSYDTILAKSPSIIYRPGGVAGGLVVTAWTEVQAFIALRQGAVIVYVDSSLAPAVVGPGVTDCMNRVVFQGVNSNLISSPSTLTVPDGAVLLNPRAFVTLILVTQATTAPNLQVSDGAIVLFQDGTTIENTGTQPCVRNASGEIALALIDGATFIPSPGPLLDLSAAPAQAILFLVVQSITNSNNVVTGVAGTTFVLKFDASISTIPTNPGFAGTTVLTPTDKAQFVEYVPAVPADWPTPPTQVAQALDELAAEIVTTAGAVIYRPGVASSGMFLATWAEVQSVVARTNGAVIVYVDDSVVSPALVPGATGITDCEGRVELRPFAVDAINYTVLQVEDGATLRNLMSVNGMELRSNCQSATPSLDWTATANGPFLELQNEAILSNASTATQPGIVVPLGATWDFFGGAGGFFLELNAPAVPLVNLSTATSTLNVTAYESSIVPSGFLSGVGILNFFYDTTTANELSPPFVFPAQPAFTGTTQLFPFGSNPQTVGSIIYRPGVASSGDFVATWPEVAALIKAYNSIAANSAQGTTGKFILYVDDGTAPAHVPASSGVTDGFGRLEIRPYRQDAQNFSQLQIDAGATLKGIYKLSGTIGVIGNPTTAVPSIDFDYTANVLGTPFPTLYIEDRAVLGTAATATQPMCVVPAGNELDVLMKDFGTIIAESASAVFQLAAASSVLEVFARSGIFESASGGIPSTWVQGPGRFEMNFDAPTAQFSNANASGAVLAPGVAFTNAATNILFAGDGLPDNYPGTNVTIQTVYVNESGGSDVNGNGSQNFPFASIQKGLSAITDATTNKRYIVEVAPGEYAGAFNFKPWVAIQGQPNTSGFYGVTEITAAAGAVGLDPSFAASGFSVFWASHLVFSNQLTLNYSASANQQIQGTFFDVNFNGGGGVGFQFIGAGTGGVDNWTLDDCLVYGGGLAQGVQFLFTIGGTQLLGGTVTIQAAPSAGATQSTTWLAQNTAVGSAFSPTNVHVLWAAPTPAVHLSALDWCNSNCVGQINLDGASSSARIAGLRPASVIQTNGASPAVVQPLMIELTFLMTATNVLSSLQAAGTIPTTGIMRMMLDGCGGGGGGGGGQSAAAGNGAGGGGGALYHSVSFDHNLADRLDIIVGAGGAGGTGGTPATPNGTIGNDGGPTYALDFSTSTVLASLHAASGGYFDQAAGGRGGASYPGQALYAAPSPNPALVPQHSGGLPFSSGFPASGGQAAAGGGVPGFQGQFGLVSFGVTGGGVMWTGGAGGTPVAGAGAPGGGGGPGPFGTGGVGGPTSATDGGAGGTPAANTGAGGGGGAGANTNVNNGGAGGSGGSGLGKLTIIVQ